MAITPARLKAVLLNTGLQQKDNPLYQVLNSIIDNIVDLDNRPIGGSGSSTTTIVNQTLNIAQSLALGDDVVDGEDGIPGNPGVAGAVGPPGPGTFNLFPNTYLGVTDGLDGMDGIGIQGLPGSTGPIGIQGTSGIDGVDGIDGAPGAAGPIGPIGLPGGFTFSFGEDGQDAMPIPPAFSNIVGSYQTSLFTSVIGTINNYNPGLNGNTVEFWNGLNDVTFTGLVGGVKGQIYTFRNLGNVSVGNAYFAFQSGSSSAVNQFTNAITSGLTPVGVRGWATWVYNGTTWQLIDHNQGEMISFSPTLAFGGASVGITYLNQFGRFYVSGIFVFVSIRMQTTSKGTSTGIASYTTLPYPTANPNGSEVGSVLDMEVGISGLTGTPYVVPNSNALLMLQTTSGVRGTVSDVNFANSTDTRCSCLYETV
jgi:hypothetical protein